MCDCTTAARVLVLMSLVSNMSLVYTYMYTPSPDKGQK